MKRAWNPDTAPQAIVINKNGNKFPENTGPVPSINFETAGICKSGATIKIPIANPTIVPTFKMYLNNHVVLKASKLVMPMR